MPASTMMHGLLLRYHYTILYSTLLLFLFSITSWILLKQSFLSPSWPLSLRPSASWAIDSEPIRARGIIVNYTTILLYYTISYYYYMVLQGCYWHGQGCSILVTGVVGNGQRSVINSSDSTNMSTVIQCCFHTSLLVADVWKISFLRPSRLDT